MTQSAPVLPLLTVSEVARHLRVSSATVRRWCEEGRLESIRPGRSYRIPRRALDELLDDDQGVA